MDAATLPPPAATAAGRTTARYLPEVQGLRTIALILVATFHIWLGKVSGGVDIFLLISAYLLTRSLAARAEAGGWTRPATFAIRKFARLLPAAAVTIALILLGGLAWLSPLVWSGMIEQALAALTYWMNVWLQRAAVDYYQQTRTDATLFQHFWSLAIQGQVFVLWPLLHLGGEWIARRLRVGVRRVLLALFAAIAVASFAHALVLVAEEPTLAYFDTGARLWEFAVGSCLALVAPLIRLPSALRRVLIWVGVAGAVSCGLVLPPEPGFPGFAGLWPVVSAALVILGADAASSPSEQGRAWRGDPIIGHRWLQVAGGYTYALYLVHWPILILAIQVLGLDRVDALAGLGILAVSAAAAVAVTWLADRPAAWMIRRDRPSEEAGWAPRVGWRVPAVLMASVLVGLLALAGAQRWFATERDRELAAAAEADPSRLGPQGPADVHAWALLPGELLASEQLSDVPPELCAEDDPHWSDMCFTTGDEGQRERSVLVVGNSHAVAYTGMILETAGREDWSVRLQVASACSFRELRGDEEPSGDLCQEVWRQTTRYILDERPDAVAVVATLSQPGADDLRFEGEGADLAAWSTRMREEAGTTVIAVRDVPRFDESPLECALRKGYDAPECEQAAAPYSPALVAYRDRLAKGGAAWVDLVPTICPQLACRPAQGGVVTYFDKGHITDLYSRSLAQAFAEQASREIGWWPKQVWGMRE